MCQPFAWESPHWILTRTPSGGGGAQPWAVIVHLGVARGSRALIPQSWLAAERALCAGTNALGQERIQFYLSLS